MRKFWQNSEIRLLLLIFGIALVLRFLYFPENIYFGFDQARDAFESQNIYQNLDLKIIGPPTADQNLFHGPLYWYLIGPLYLFGGGDPSLPAAFMRVINILGVFLIFWIGSILFNKRVGLLASALYAFSFEQTQYAIYFHHPPLAVLTIMLFYGGLALAIFKKDWRGIPLSLFGYGLSVQSEFQLPYLGLIFLLLTFIFRKKILPLIDLRSLLISILAFVVPMSTFILAELRFGARTTKGLLAILSKTGTGGGNLTFAFGTYVERLSLQIHDNIFGLGQIAPALLVLFLGIALFFILRKKRDYEKILFLLIWFLSTAVLLVFGPIRLYYTNVGISPAILLLASSLISKISSKTVILLILGVIVLSNISLVLGQNYKGVISDIQVQEGMLLGRQEAVIDYIYQEAGGRPIVVSAMTMPLKVNTTWAYLFDWYGKAKYGRLPYWAGEAAEGYPGQGLLERWQSQEEKYQFFSIIEPRRGIREPFVQQFLEEQEQYGKVVEERSWGDEWYAQLVVQKRE